MTINVTPIPKLTQFVTPAISFGVAAANGSAATAIRSDSGIIAFNASDPDPITFGQSGGPGSVNFASRIDHLHAMEAEAGSILCRAYNNASQSVADSTAVKLALNAEQLDTDSMHDTSTNNSRITFNTAGQYLCGLNTLLGGGANHEKSYILLNNTTIIANNETTHAAGGNIRQAVSTLYNFDEDDYIELVVYQNTGGSITAGYAAYASPILWAVRVG